MEQLFALYHRKVQMTNSSFYRYLYNQIDWRNRLIVIKGSKGVGKTTLLMQHIKNNFEDLDKALYLSLDHLWFTRHNLLEITEYFYTHGGTHLFLDEVHKYPNWEQEVKNIYDFYPDLHVVVTGSSMLKISESVKGDLSRRHKMYELRGLSFREYLKLEGIADIEPIDLKDILHHHTTTAARIASEIKILPLFEQYLEKGYYPFYRDEGSGFDERLLQVIDSIITSEIPSICKINYSTTYKIKRFLAALAVETPYTLNITALCKSLETTRNNLLKIIDMIDAAGIIRKLYLKDNLRGLVKPEKILFDNTNIIYAFGRQNTGTIRESFFTSQISKDHTILMPEDGDFYIDNKVTIEVGGRKKGFSQIKDLPDCYVAADGIEIGGGNKIPLWLFGLLY